MSKRKPIYKMIASEYQNHCDDHNGICLTCGSIQYGGCEGDARGYKCKSCGKNRVFGVKEALMMGRIKITDEKSNHE